jgi:cell division protein FtsA
MSSSEGVLAVGVDAGSTRTRCVITRLCDEELVFEGYGEAESQGWNRGRISDQKAVTEGILEAIRQAERSAKVSVESAVLGMGGATIHGSDSRGVNDFGRYREIDQSDINHAIERAYRVPMPEDRMVLQLCPQDFTVSGHSGHRSPRGARGERLDAHVHLITASVQEHHSLLGAANQAYLQVEETVFEALAAAYGTVLPEERRQGLALVDIGAHSSGLVVYLGDALLLASSIPVCGDHFTRDVSRGFRLQFEEAERLKIEYGSAISTLTADNSYVEIPSPEGRAAREESRRQLNMILEARAEELFDYVREQLARIGMHDGLMSGVVLTGGGARLQGMCDVADRTLNCQSRNGLPVGVRDWPQELLDPAWSTAAGLAMYSARLKVQEEAARRSAGLLVRLLGQ